MNFEAAGIVYTHYNPMSPPQWGMAQFSPHYTVYRNVTEALVAFTANVRDIVNENKETEHRLLPVFFRGQSDSRARLLPTRLRSGTPAPRLSPKFGFGIESDVPPEELVKFRRINGRWGREEKPMRSAEDSAVLLSESRIAQLDATEETAVEEAAKRSPAVAALDPFRRRAAVRHYAGATSSLLDVTTDPHVAAYFASADPHATDGEETYGAIWAIDINRLATMFDVKRAEVPGGEEFILTDRSDDWGANKQWFKESGLIPVTLLIRNVTLPLARPTAQKGRFFSISGADGKPLPLLAELTWWSLIERWSYMAAFVQTGEVYEHLQAGICRRQLFPPDEVSSGFGRLA